MGEHSIDPAITDAVLGVSHRFGVVGLEQMIEVAGEELVGARAALEGLAAED